MCTVYHFVPLCDDAFRQHHDALFSLCTMYFPYDSAEFFFEVDATVENVSEELQQVQDQRGRCRGSPL